MFVGIARTNDVENYLQGVAHDGHRHRHVAVRGELRRPRRHGPRGGSRELTDLGRSEQGSGKQTLNWEIEDGDYSVVVMNADGSAGVDADVSTGANIPFLDEIAWTAVGSGSSCSSWASP